MAAVTVAEVAVADSTVVAAPMAAATMVEDPPTAGDEKVLLTVVAAGTKVRRRHAVPVLEEVGPRRVEVLVTPPRDGIRLEDSETAAAETVRMPLAFTQPLPTGNGTPLEARIAWLARDRPRTPAWWPAIRWVEMVSSDMAGAALGVIADTDLAGEDAAAGDLAMALAGDSGVLFGFGHRTGTTRGGATTILQSATFILIPTSRMPGASVKG